ncbi:MAG: cysteine desulfurase, partial [Nanoarchaeota archaeon]
MINKLKKDFPMLNKTIYLDNAASSLTPTPVVKAMEDYYKKYRANVHRGLYKEAEKATKEYELAREKVAQFINASPEEIIFTSGATAGINLLAYSLIKGLKEGDEIILSEMEHHSNLVPWQQLAKEKKLILRFIKIKNFQLDIEDFKKKISSKTKIISVAYVSNVLGTINPIVEIANEARKCNALFIVDAAQAAGHISIDIKKLDCDFLCFSAHKMLGPTGIGVLYGKKTLLEKISPFLYGGSMIKSVSFFETEFTDIPLKFEAGTPNISGAIGLAAAIDYLNKIGIKNIE